MNYISNILDIYKTLVRIRDNNHAAKRGDVYSKDDIQQKYYYKRIELLNVIKRINSTNPKGISIEVKIDKEMYLVKIKVDKNPKYRIHQYLFQFHTPIDSISDEVLKDFVKK